ncbi:hypothetical protein EWM64_g4710 [Hericium alpestre]|uniref:Uncharacterized protein n=1 Tax=Hericium alpestre TaxID=135208 RepID=A0A4Y9ZYM9_9AGAM|nr:hypothetical protein EWM64_g4710 [Hericium alpestre]
MAVTAGSRAFVPAGHGASHAGSVDNTSKASALLDSVLDSIQSPRVHPINVHVNQKEAASETAMHSPTDTELSSPSRRRRALADALFGGPEADRAFSLPELTGKNAEDDVTGTVHQKQGESSQIARAGSRGAEQAASIPQNISIDHTDPTPSQTSPVIPASASAPTYTDHNELAKEVQRRAEAAMAQLRKMPSNPKINDSSASAHKKRISPNQISSPRLVSASTSVDTIPLRSPSAASGQLNSSKLGQRFKKLRGTLRAKQTLPTGQDITPYPVDLLSPASAQTDRYRTTSPTHDTGAPVAASATDLGRFKVPVPSPPASAGPRLKGFMARFRKPRSTDGPPDADRRKAPVFSSTTPLLTIFGQQQQPAFAQQHHAFAQQHHSAPADALSFDGHDLPPSSQPRAQDAPATSSEYVLPQIDHSRSQSDAALRQLFDAAENLGLDQAALNDLLARSGSISSKSTAPKWSSKHTSASTSEASGDQLDLTAIQRVRSPTSSDGRPSMERFTARQVSESTVRKLSLRKQAPRASTSDAPELPSSVLRRTLIFPAEARQSTADFNVAALRKSSSMRRRRASAASALSNRSIHDRVPTPPPPRSPTNSRFSPDPSPPMPELPAGLVSFGEGSQSLLQPPLPLEKSSSAYDSLYEMYAGDGKPSISVTGEASTDPAAVQMNFDGLSNMEPGSAVEVLELANGETIWSIVNGLRDDDTESYYGNRASFRSEYSFRDNDGVQVFFKDHGRKTSKDSNASYLSRRKTYQSQAPKRPETKVFFSSSQQIGRLIDNLSQGMEAGSFNIIPSRPGASSAAGSSFHSESDTHWTVEERLEHMLGSMATT